MVGTGSAAKRNLGTQGLAGTMDPHGGIVRCYAGFLGKLLHGEPVYLATTKRLSILRLEGVEELRNTLADDRLQLCVGLRRALHLACQPLQRSRRRSSASVMVYHGITQRTVKPGEHRLPFAQGLDTLKPPRERLLKNIFGNCPVAHPTLQEREKRAVVGDQRQHDSLGERLSDLIAFCLHMVMGTAHAVIFPRAAPFGKSHL